MGWMGHMLLTNKNHKKRKKTFGVHASHMNMMNIP